MKLPTLQEPAREIPVDGEYDLIVLGGSCTGLFAAIRAARLGLSVAVVERMGSFGGVATISRVNIWHSRLDTVYEKEIFAGLTTEVMERLEKRNAVTVKPNNPSSGWVFNSAEMQIELDELVVENKITPWLHTAFVSPHVVNGELDAIIIESKSGRGALKARFFIDATGDGDLCHRLGVETYIGSHRQPSTTCALFEGWGPLKEKYPIQKLISDHGKEFEIPDGFIWGSQLPSSNAHLLAGTRTFDDCSDARGFTQAEMEGRRQIRAIQDLLRKYAPDCPVTLLDLPARIGIRQTRHIRSQYQLTGDDVLYGKQFEDAIAYGSYRVDVHHDDKPGLTFRYLNGTEHYVRPGHPHEVGRWRSEQAVDPTYYQIPYRCLIPQTKYNNLLAAGRFIDADEQAHGAIRVMVNMNQTGEAAGTAAWLALRNETSAAAVKPSELRGVMAENGSIML